MNAHDLQSNCDLVEPDTLARRIELANTLCLLELTAGDLVRVRAEDRAAMERVYQARLAELVGERVS